MSLQSGQAVQPRLSSSRWLPCFPASAAAAPAAGAPDPLRALAPAQALHLHAPDLRPADTAAAAAAALGMLQPTRTCR